MATVVKRTIFSGYRYMLEFKEGESILRGKLSLQSRPNRLLGGFLTCRELGATELQGLSILSALTR